ncbi:hypothetical protein KFL_001830030 [Klebsormidium nitens]|uniref:Protein root UVB sensitive 3 n=1 Tax=Klebsormidium nitens TaxID=105231 RepID=A0A1Y1I037_KLENI|nr:hypothetical protein KFL_001830030 [Klebsormidium nitens]|eukprot:GAQ84275.1 hypothetical protein KFL_001830030 [Klebsormidium nitens]
MQVEEYRSHGAGSPTALWQWKKGGQEVVFARGQSASIGALQKVASAFLPEGYPSSVTPDYVSFQVWDTLQGLSTYIRSMISTQVLLAGFGVGEASKTAAGATFQWFLRDFTGMLGGILFTLYQGSSLDSNAKQWRLAADFINDLAMLLDLLSPLFPNAFLTMLCLGSVLRAVTGTASGATRAALTQHFALRNNAADISAKEGSQETLATITGMLLGMAVARWTAGHVVLMWTVFLSLTAFHMYANFRAVRSLCLTSISPERAALLLQSFRDSTHESVLEPHELPGLETVLPLPRQLRRSAPISDHVVLGARLSALRLGPCAETLHLLQQRYRGEMYLLLYQDRLVHVILHRGATPAHILQSYVHALRLVEALSGGLRGFILEKDESGIDAAELEAAVWMTEYYDTFLEKLQSKSWATDKVLLAPREWRASWKIDTS